jgi:hypothetical protein
MITTHLHHLPQYKLSAVEFLIIARFLTFGSCESTSFLFARSNLFGGCLPFESTTYLTKLNTFGG